MHKNSTMLTASLVALVLAFGGSAAQAEEGGGMEATQADMPKICDDQAEDRQLTGAERTSYLKQCNESTPQSVSRSARKMEGTK